MLHFKSKTFYLLPTLLALIHLAIAAEDTQYVTTYDEYGDAIAVRDDRQPSLWTRKFADCSGDPQIIVSRFDAAYYKDNMTVLFHLEASTELNNQSLMSMPTGMRYS